MAENADISGKTFSKTFRDYVLEHRNFTDLESGLVRSTTAATVVVDTPAPQVTARQAASVSVATDAPAKVVAAPAAASDDVSATASIDALVAKIEADSDVARKKELIYGLDESVRTEVVNAIKLRKERAEKAKLALESELDDLFKP
jgi:hypothetical protein